MADFTTKYGPWALVTGASSGIGAEFSQQLGAKGINVVLVARRQELLEKRAKELKATFGIDVMTVCLDLAEAGAVEHLRQLTKDLDIGLIIPNAGMETNGQFMKISLEDQTRLLQLNCTAPMQMAHTFGARLIERGRGGILFVASTFAYQAVPFFGNYAASKSYVLSFGESLHYELQGKGIDVTVLAPGLTATEMPEKINLDFSKLPMKSMEVEPVVTLALNALERNKSSVIPGMMNNLFAFMAQRLMPRETIASMFGGMIQKARPH